MTDGGKGVDVGKDIDAAPGELRGVDLARRALEQARDAARRSGKAVGNGRAAPVAGRRAGVRTRRGWSSAAPDDRDPQRLGVLTGVVARSRGWSGKVAEGTIFGCWQAVVGADIADHAVPASLRGGELGITAESTAWATQLRLMQAQILAKIRVAVGPDMVTSLRITGPTAHSWRKGQRHVSGLGPRDTYG